MKLAVLFSGGKDSNFALYKASKNNEILCLISMISENKESYMFQTPGNDFIDFQAKVMEIPLIRYATNGEKEYELEDLKLAIQKAIKNFKIEGIVTGAIKSVYQASRIQKICNELDIYCFNPLWQIDEKDFLNQLITEKFEVLLLGIYSYPFTKKYIGKIFNNNFRDELFELNDKFKVSVVGEGGEMETFVLDSPMFKKKLKIIDFEIIMDSENAGLMNIKKIEVKEK